MKYLKIEDNQGFFTIDGNNWKPIDQIGKDDLLRLVDIAVENEFQMDEYDNEQIANPAHRIVYSNIYERFTQLLNNRDRFKDESQTLYRDAIEKYSK
jgi:hypothetical protein